jgi:hypothetical protein
MRLNVLLDQRAFETKQKSLSTKYARASLAVPTFMKAV